MILRRLPFPLRAGPVAALLLGATVLPAGAISYVESSGGLVPPSMEGGRTELEFADVDLDGNLDLVSIGDHGSPNINSDQHGIMVWFGDGEGGWSVLMTGNFGYGGIAIGDLNGDGLPDAAYGMHHDYSGTDFGNQLIEAALGDGTGAHWLPWDDGLATDGESWGMFGTDLADVDRDGDLDLGSNSFGCCAGVHVYENHGDGSWSPFFGTHTGNSSMWFEFGDINADGAVDFVAANQDGRVYLGDGAGGFANVDGNLPPGYAGTSLGDIDNDGDLDLAYRGTGGSAQVWLWNDDGVWTSAAAGLPSSGVDLTELVDMDGDGWLDLVGMGGGSVRIWLGDGGSSWQLAATIPLPPAGYAQAMRVGGDIDHNGLPDIAVVNEEGSWPNERNHLRVFRETSSPQALATRFVRPLGGEVLVGGSVQFVEWLVAVPGQETVLVALELSVSGPDGPWSPVASNLTAAGRYQWVVPVVGLTENARLRIRVEAGGDQVEAVTPRSFTILPPVAGHTPESPGGSVTVRPNPFRTSVSLRFPEPGPRGVPIQIFDPAGRLVRTLPRLEGLGEEAGSVGAVTWDGRDGAGHVVPAGLYLVRQGRHTAVLVRVP